MDLTGIPAPTAAEVGSVLRSLDLQAEDFNPAPVDPASITDYPTETRETTDAIELGYKAALGSRWNVGADVAYSYTKNFFGASVIGTPNVFLDEASLAAYLTPYLGGDADLALQLAQGMTQIPLGVVTPANAADPTALLNLRHQGGSFSRVGVDLEVSYLLTDGLTISGNYSWVNRDSIGSAGGSDMAVLSAPKNKGALAVSYRPPTSWWGVWAQGVAVETYPVKSGRLRGHHPGLRGHEPRRHDATADAARHFAGGHRLQPLRRGAPGVRRGARHRPADHHACAGAVLAGDPSRHPPRRHRRRRRPRRAWFR